MGLFGFDSEDDSDEESENKDLEENEGLLSRVTDGLFDSSRQSIRLHDYRNIDQDLKTGSGVVIVDEDALEFENIGSGILSDGASFTIPTNQIDFERVETWTRENHEKKSGSKRLYMDDDEIPPGERTFIKLPLQSEGYLTISMSMGSKTSMADSPNDLLRRLSEISGVQLEKKEGRSDSVQATDENDGQDPLDQLERLKELREQGAITEDEFKDKKQDLLDQI